MKKLAIIILGSSFLVGCATRGLYDAGGAAAGGAIGNYVGKGDPLYTAAGAAGGVLLAEGFQSASQKAQITAAKRGYDKGKSDAVKQQYWVTQNFQKNINQKTDEARVTYYPIATPAREVNGVRFNEQTHYVRIEESPE